MTGQRCWLSSQEQRLALRPLRCNSAPPEQPQLTSLLQVASDEPAKNLGGDLIYAPLRGLAVGAMLAERPKVTAIPADLLYGKLAVARNLSPGVDARSVLLTEKYAPSRQPANAGFHFLAREPDPEKDFGPLRVASTAEKLPASRCHSGLFATAQDGLQP